MAAATLGLNLREFHRGVTIRGRTAAEQLLVGGIGNFVDDDIAHNGACVGTERAGYLGAIERFEPLSQLVTGLWRGFDSDTGLAQALDPFPHCRSRYA